MAISDQFCPKSATQVCFINAIKLAATAVEAIATATGAVSMLAVAMGIGTLFVVINMIIAIVVIAT